MTQSSHHGIKSKPDFEYTPLDLSQKSIRLLEIHLRRHGNDPIQCTMRHASLDERHTCLSYVWGPDEPLRSIYINGSRFEVRENLHEFLKAASLKKARQRKFHWKYSSIDAGFHIGQILGAIWIDALCIDQKNSHEKTHQVRLFGDIYSSAKCTIAWMGTSSRLQGLFWVWKLLHMNLPVQLRIFNKVIAKSTGYNKTVDACFIDHSYWTRAWTTQESLLAKRFYLMVADRVMPVYAILHPEARRKLEPFKLHLKRKSQGNAAYDLKQPFQAYHGYKIWDQVNLTNRAVKQKKKPENEMTSLDRLWKFRGKQCAEPRDKIFSLLSVSKNGQETNVDYDCALEHLALQFLRANEKQFCLCHTAMVFDTLQAEIHALVPSSSINNETNIVDLHWPIPVSLEKARSIGNKAPDKDNPPEENASQTSPSNRVLSVSLTCGHLETFYLPWATEPYIRIARCGHLHLDMPDRGAPRTPAYPVIWRDPITKMETAFSQDEKIYVSRGDQDDYVLGFSLQAFARLVTLLGDLESRLQYRPLLGGYVDKAETGPKWTLLPEGSQMADTQRALAGQPLNPEDTAKADIRQENCVLAGRLEVC